MKKLLLTVIAALAFCGSIFAQDFHWQFNPNDYEDFDIIIAYVQIDGVYVTAEDDYANLEVASFDEQGNCRGTVFVIYDDLDEYPTAGVCVNYNSTGETITFRMYDHGTDTEYTGTLLNIDNYETGAGEFFQIWNGETPEPTLNFTPIAAQGYTRNITPYTNDKDNYCLIASPVGTVDATAVTNLLANSYDLYAFDQSEDLEWRNYKANAFQLEQGKGYLYANSGNGANTYQITFNGNAFNEDYLEVDLTYDENAGDFPGWNLVGNPYAVEAYILCHDYYVMNADGYEAIAETTGTPLAPMTGAFVIADPDVEDDYVIFTNSLTSGASCGEGMGEEKVVLNLSNGRNVIDRAVVRFGEGRTLPKLQLRENSTKVYFTVDDKDYAIVRSANQGEMPVNFKAEHNGSYTFTVDAQASDFNYLHLIDNRNGADVDLLASPSYTFDALTTDYASRFRLVFATGNADDTFAFASNGSWVISNQGPATVQVVDVNGRIMSSQNINGSASINFSAAAGVYMIRLVNGDNVKVQKVVVK